VFDNGCTKDNLAPFSPQPAECRIAGGFKQIGYAAAASAPGGAVIILCTTLHIYLGILYIKYLLRGSLYKIYRGA
jgi:hypothetical protein